jgi:hypothetical protein
MHDVVDSPYPDPGKGKDPGNDPGGHFSFAVRKDASNDAEDIGDDLCRPDCSIIRPEDIEELLYRERQLHGDPPLQRHHDQFVFIQFLIYCVQLGHALGSKRQSYGKILVAAAQAAGGSVLAGTQVPVKNFFDGR